MVTRYRWYRIQLPSHAINLLNIIDNNPFVHNANFGFVHIEEIDCASTYRFFWRTKVIVTQIDDSGSLSYQNIASVEFTNFSIINIEGEIFFRFENPSKNINNLLNTLESIIGLGFACKLLTFERSKPTTIFEQLEEFNLVGLKVVNAVIDKDIVSRIELVSKQGMSIDKIELLEGISYKIDSTTYDLLYQGIRGQIVISASGTIKVSGALAPKLIHLIEQDFARLLSLTNKT